MRLKEINIFAQVQIAKTIPNGLSPNKKNSCQSGMQKSECVQSFLYLSKVSSFRKSQEKKNKISSLNWNF